MLSNEQGGTSCGIIKLYCIVTNQPWLSHSSSGSQTKLIVASIKANLCESCVCHAQASNLRSSCSLNRMVITERCRINRLLSRTSLNAVDGSTAYLGSSVIHSDESPSGMK